MTMFKAPEDLSGLEAKVKDIYRAVAQEPHGGYHFELGRDLAERLGYPALRISAGSDGG